MFNGFLGVQVSKLFRKLEPSIRLEYLLLFFDDKVWMHWNIFCGGGEANINPATAPDSIPSPTKPGTRKNSHTLTSLTRKLQW